MLTVLSLGAGVQSSAILHMILNKDLPPVDAVIYLDAGWEPNYTIHQADYLNDLCYRHGLPFIHHTGPSIRAGLAHVIRARLRPGPYKHLPLPLFTLDDAGHHGQLPRRCTREFRLAPLFRMFRREIIPADRQNGQPKPWLKVLLGISDDEKHRAKASREKWKVNIFPLVDRGFDRRDCLLYLSDHEHPIPHRSSCVCCPYRSNSAWSTLRRLDPENWEAACDLDSAVRKLGRPGTQLFLHSSRTPLATHTPTPHADLFIT